MIVTCTRQIDLEMAKEEAKAIIEGLEKVPVGANEKCEHDIGTEIQYFKTVEGVKVIQFGFVVDYVPGYSLYAVLPRERKNVVMVDVSNVIKAC